MRTMAMIMVAINETKTVKILFNFVQNHFQRKNWAFNFIFVSKNWLSSIQSNGLQAIFWLETFNWISWN